MANRYLNNSRPNLTNKVAVQPVTQDSDWHKLPFTVKSMQYLSWSQKKLSRDARPVQREGARYQWHLQLVDFEMSNETAVVMADDDFLFLWYRRWTLQSECLAARRSDKYLFSAKRLASEESLYTHKGEEKAAEIDEDSSKASHGPLILYSEADSPPSSLEKGKGRPRKAILQDAAKRLKKRQFLGRPWRAV
ncbi:hypothetical protein KEM48_007973 [Puccinia striiformis f. sp. tritici PST-130]|nr:hypothetical protein KEM48_007973 [Puccinia striiformis f. sp. tritici PST-130]